MASALVFRGAPVLWQIVVSSRSLPLWDMAKYGLSGLRLLDFVAQGDLWAALNELNSMSVWPPFWPVVTSMGFAVLGDSFSTPRLLMVGVWSLTILGTVWATRPLPAGLWIGSAVAAWFFSGSLFQGLATLNLLELPGLLLMILASGCYLRALTVEQNGVIWWRATAICGLCLVLCKYNYGLMWWLPWMLNEMRRRAGSWAISFQRFRHRLGGLSWRDPLWLAIVGLAVLLLLIRATGGFQFTLAGRLISLTSVGSPAYYLYLLLGWWAVSRAKWLDRLRRLSPEDLTLVRWFGCPLAVWMAIPPHVKDLFGFLENRSSGLSSAEALGFYPDALLRLYAPDPIVGICVALAAVVGLRELGADSSERRFVALCWVVGIGALLAHPYKLPRFAFHTAWWTAALAATTLFPYLVHRSKSVIRSLPAVSAISASVLALAHGIDSQEVLDRHRLWTAPADIRPMLEDLTRPREGQSEPVLILGAWNGLSPALIELAARFEASESSVLPMTGYQLARRSSDRLMGRLKSGRYPSVALVSHRSSLAFDQETAWLEPARVFLRGDPLYRATTTRQSKDYIWFWYERDISIK